MADKYTGKYMCLASYPRSGNTWLRYMIADLIFQIRGQEATTNLPGFNRIIPDLAHEELSGRVLRIDGLPFVKTHQEYTPSFVGGIYVYRDPADTLISHYYYRRDHIADPNDMTTNWGIEPFCFFMRGAWKRHLQSYIEAVGNGASFTFISYRRLHINAFKCLDLAAQALGILTDCDVVKRATMLQQAVNRHTFARQRAVAETTTFFRKGQMGRAVYELDRDVLERIVVDCRPVYHTAVSIELDQ